MDIQINCSEVLEEKLIKQLSNIGINVVANAKLVLVEMGFELPKGKICISFEPIEYVDVIHIVSSYYQSQNIASDTITGFSNNRYSLVTIGDVMYIEVQDSQLLGYTNDQNYFIKGTLTYYENILKAKHFIRINKSQIVNLMYVKEIVPWFNSRLVLVLDGGVELEVSKHYSKIFKKTLNL